MAHDFNRTIIIRKYTILQKETIPKHVAEKLVPEITGKDADPIFYQELYGIRGANVLIGKFLDIAENLYRGKAFSTPSLTTPKPPVASKVVSKQVRLYGQGLSYGFVEESQRIDINHEQIADENFINVASIIVEKPLGNIDVKVESRRARQVGIEYLPKRIGLHALKISYKEELLQNRLITIFPKKTGISKNIPHVEIGPFRPGVLSKFVVDTSRAGQDELWVSIWTRSGPCHEKKITYDGDGLFTVSFLIEKYEDALIRVQFGDKGVLGFPCVIRPVSDTSPNDCGDVNVTD